MAIFFSILQVIDFLIFNVIAESTDVINTSSGPIQGKVLTTVAKNVRYSVFKGIRYAEQTDRFRPAVFVAPWSDVLSATSPGPECAQLDLLSNFEFKGEENCLFLNVFTPLTDFGKNLGEPKAVMFWIHGPGWSTGTSDPRIYGPDFLMENDVIVVTFNYRLGLLGFLALKNQNATGNVGLIDQYLALIWVNKNIEKFGGDPKKITIFGQDAGGASVLYHALSNKSRGLFSGAIAMSGTPMEYWAFDLTSKSVEKALALGRNLGLKGDDENELFSLLNETPVEKLLNASRNIRPGWKPVRQDPLTPSSFFTTCMVEQFATGDFSQVPFILGFMHDETLVFTGNQFSEEILIGEAIEVANIFNSNFSIPNAFNYSRNDSKTELIKETTDLFFISGIEQTRRFLTASSKQSVFYYQISLAPNSSIHKSFFNIDEIGAANGDDLAYLWWIPDANVPLDPYDEISITRERMVRMWTNFAKYGNPTPDELNDSLLNFTWPVSGSTPLILNINEKISVQPYINENSDAIIAASSPYLATQKGCDEY